ncbi:MAG TPA: methyltransferase [Bacteroidales bacterium]|nr:methyltransferase [Bacteroidales bacterium]
MSNDYFAFRRFTVIQDRCAMKVGTDGVLLGAWTEVKNAERILDVGTGTGLIALMCAQRSDSFIDAVEIDPDASDQATVNFKNSPWKDRIQVYCKPFQQYALETLFTYDVIVSNPPYFRNSLKPPDGKRSLARHDDRLDAETLIHNSIKLLSPTGHLAVILPYDQSDQFINHAWFNQLYVYRKSTVRPYPGKNFTRCLVEFGRQHTANFETNEILIRKGEKDGYSEEYRDLTADFYLNI